MSNPTQEDLKRATEVAKLIFSRVEPASKQKELEEFRKAAAEYIAQALSTLRQELEGRIQRAKEQICLCNGDYMPEKDCGHEDGEACMGAIFTILNTTFDTARNDTAEPDGEGIR